MIILVLITLAILILGTMALAALARAAAQVQEHVRRERRHRQTIRSLFAACDQQPAGCAHRTRRVTDRNPTPAAEEDIDHQLGYDQMVPPALLRRQAD